MKNNNEDKIKILQIIIITLLVLLLIITYINCINTQCSISPNDRLDNIDQDIMYLNEQYYYNSLCQKNKKIYNELGPNEKLNSIKTDLYYKIIN